MLFKKNKEQWKLKIFYLGQYMLSVDIQETELIFNNTYVCTVWFKKHIFKTNRATVIFHPVSQLRFDKEKKEWLVEAEIYRGVQP